MRLLLVALLTCAATTSLEAQRPKRCTGTAPDSTLGGPPVYRDCEVDKPARRTGAEPRLDLSPPSGPRREGCVVVEFEMIVDSTGRVEPASLVVRRSDMREFEAAVRESTTQLQYRPAEKDGVKVRQVVVYRRTVSFFTSVGRGPGTPPAGSNLRCR